MCRNIHLNLKLKNSFKIFFIIHNDTSSIELLLFCIHDEDFFGFLISLSLFSLRSCTSTAIITVAPSDPTLRGGPLVKNHVFGDNTCMDLEKRLRTKKRKKRRRRRKSFHAIFPSSRHGLIHVARDNRDVGSRRDLSHDFFATELCETMLFHMPFGQNKSRKNEKLCLEM